MKGLPTIKYFTVHFYARRLAGDWSVRDGTTNTVSITEPQLLGERGDKSTGQYLKYHNA